MAMDLMVPIVHRSSTLAPMVIAIGASHWWPLIDMVIIATMAPFAPLTPMATVAIQWWQWLLFPYGDSGLPMVIQWWPIGINSVIGDSGANGLQMMPLVPMNAIAEKGPMATIMLTSNHNPNPNPNHCHNWRHCHFFLLMAVLAVTLPMPSVAPMVTNGDRQWCHWR